LKPKLIGRGDIYVVSLDPAQRHEQQRTRPVLIVSPERFNALTRVPIVVPITPGGKFARTAGFAVSLMNAGTRTTGVIRCDQPRPLDLHARKARKMESVPENIMDEVLARLAPIFT
jgi:mRNA interferase ChpB